MNDAIDKLEKYSYPDPNTGCILWFGCTNSDGYGNLYYKGKYYKAHRLSYEANKGVIQKGNYICHTCDTPQCINPDHLWQGTQKKNMEDAKSKGRAFKLKSHCRNGHEFTKENTGYTNSHKNGYLYRYRVCKKCSHDHYISKVKPKRRANRG